MSTLVTILFLTLFSGAGVSASPKPLILPICQDAATKLLVAHIYGRTPLVSNGFIVDLTAEDMWANCETNYQSSTFRQPVCGSPECKTANTRYCFNICSKFTRPFCHNNTCGRYLENPASHQTTIGEVSQDVISFRSTKPGPAVQIPNFLFTCAPSALVDIGLPKGVQGVAGLAQGSIALHNQLASRVVGLKPIFTLCIPSTSSGNGVIFFGSNGPYTFPGGVDASKNLVYTPIIIDPYREYYIHIKSISVDRKPVPINKTLLSVSNIGTGGGTTFNTLLRYTVLEGSIYKALLTSFAKQLRNIRPVKQPIAPFGLCYESKNFGPSPLWPGVPSIDLEVEGKGQGEVWSILGENSMVEAKPGVLCLAFVNGGPYRAAVNIGNHQMKDVIMEFDLSRSRLGIGYPLAGYRTACHHFNFN